MTLTSFLLARIAEDEAEAMMTPRPSFRVVTELMLRHPDLYSSVAWLAAHETVRSERNPLHPIRAKHQN